MHHMSLRHGLRSFSAKRRRTVSRDTLSCAVSLTSSPDSSSSVQRARPAGGLEQAVATSRAFLLARELAVCSGARLFAERRLQVAEDEAALSPIDGRAAHADIGRDRLVAGAAIRRQQYLRPLEPACRMLAAAQKLRQFGAFG